MAAIQKSTNSHGAIKFAAFKSGVPVKQKKINGFNYPSSLSEVQCGSVKMGSKIKTNTHHLIEQTTGHKMTEARSQFSFTHSKSQRRRIGSHSSTKEQMLG